MSLSFRYGPGAINPQFKGAAEGNKEPYKRRKKSPCKGRKEREMTREEILKLHELSEEVTVSVLTTLGVLRLVMGEYDGESKYESLAECAFRMRDEFMQNHSVKCWEEQIKNNSIRCWKEQIKELLDAGVYASGTWTALSQPIHWIQAALLARLENEK